MLVSKGLAVGQVAGKLHHLAVVVGYVAGAAQVVGVVEVLLVLGRGGAVGVAVMDATTFLSPAQNRLYAGKACHHSPTAALPTAELGVSLIVLNDFLITNFIFQINQLKHLILTCYSCTIWQTRHNF